MAQGGEVGQGRLRAGQQDEVCRDRERAAGRHDLDRDVGLGAERVEIVEIGDARQAWHGDQHALAGAPGRLHRVEGDGILGRQRARGREPRHDAEGGPARPLLYHLGSAGEEAGIAAELVDDEALDADLLGARQQCMRADDGGEDAAAVDVADEDDRHVRRLGKAHIGDVALAQIGLGGAAGALDEDEVGFGAEPGEALEHARQEARLQRLVLARRRVAGDAALHDDLRAGLGLGLEENRVHVGGRRDEAGPRLERLRAADLAAIPGDGGVVRHVLRLEGAHREPAPRESAAEPGDKQRLADIRARALQHQRRDAMAVIARQARSATRRPPGLSPRA